MIFAVLDVSLAVNLVYKLQFFYIYRLYELPVNFLLHIWNHPIASYDDTNTFVIYISHENRDASVAAYGDPFVIY